MLRITAKTTKTVQLSCSPYFVRDSDLKGFALRVFPSGTIKYFAETWHNGRSHRKTLGTYPILDLKDARKKAVSFIRSIQEGVTEGPPLANVSLKALFFLSWRYRYRYNC